MAAACGCLSLLLLSTCVPLLGARGAPLEPLYPGENTTPEQMAQCTAELRRYINMLTKPSASRYGERDKEDTLAFSEWGPPMLLSPELSPLDL
uniref:Pancreatic polypeptide n=1 Tax=Pan paniscus TaxID=9597 RepID=A0A2R9BYP1_PANPA